ncbi:MAG TPA: hypothetical protein VFH89_15405 [Sphingomicrobium sp.]|nr:hypothetical protein [Sphingomicrobium sp.]
MQPASATRNDAIPSVGSEVLAEGLMLVRASTLKIIRLQLAMERRDRRVALEAVDDLVALDRSLEEFLTNVPAAEDDSLFNNVLELERSALNVEKHTLAAGISNRGWEVETAEPEVALEAEADWTYDEPEGEHWSWWRRVAILAAVIAIACAAYWLGASGLVPGFIREVL